MAGRPFPEDLIAMAQLIRSWKRMFGLTSRRVTVQAHVPWYWRWLGVMAVGGFVVGVGWSNRKVGAAPAGETWIPGMEGFAGTGRSGCGSGHGPGPVVP